MWGAWEMGSGERVEEGTGEREGRRGRPAGELVSRWSGSHDAWLARCRCTAINDAVHTDTDTNSLKHNTPTEGTFAAQHR